MSANLNAEKSRVNSLEAEVQTLQDIRDSLQEQIRLLEERVATEETRCQQAQVCIHFKTLPKWYGCLALAEARCSPRIHNYTHLSRHIYLNYTTVL